jgi:threonine dehydrogenase-like Zn-dependent dehydrogenase
MCDKMKAVAVTSEKKIEIIEINKPAIKPNQVLVKIKACALCTYEQRVYTGVKKFPLPFIGGHEIAGEIVQAGSNVDVSIYKPGTRVAARILYKCGVCYYCHRGKENLCVDINKQLINEPGIYGIGGLGQYVALDTTQIWILPEDISFEKAALTEPLACIVNSVWQGNPQLGDDVVIIGGGIMGMLHLLCLKLQGTRIIMSEPDEKRRNLALELGCDYVIDPFKTDPVKEVKELTDGRGADVVFNTTSISSVAEQAVQMTGYLGRCVMYSSQHPDVPIKISTNWLHNSEAVITGAVSPSIRSFDAAVNLLSKNIINPEKLISAVFDYTEAAQAFEAAIRPDTYRVIIKF